MARRSRSTTSRLLEARTRGATWAQICYGAALGLIIAVVYGPSVKTPFIFDDEPAILQNPSLFRLWPLFGSPPDFGPLNPPRLSPTSGRPLVNLTFAINYQIGGLNPVGYHLFNLTLHWLAALLLMAIVQRTLQLDFFRERFGNVATPLGFLTALVWALHPLQSETVVYTTQRTELLVGFFYLAVFYAALRYWASSSSASRGRWLTVATAVCFAGAMCKEVIVTAPVLVLLFERTFVTGSFRKAVRQSWPLYVGLFSSWLLLLWLNIDRPRADSAGFDLGIPAYVWWFTQAKLLWTYFRLIVWPWPLLIHYLTPYVADLRQAWPWLLMTAALIVATVVLLWRRHPAGFVGAWVLIILSPTLIIPIVTEVGAERRMYLPLAAIAALVVGLGYAVVKKSPVRSKRDELNAFADSRRRLVPVVVLSGLLVIVWAAVDIRRVSAYKNAESLWDETVAEQLDDYQDCNYWGAALLKSGRVQEALGLFRRSVQLNPNNSFAHYNLGLALSQTSRPLDAIKEDELALKLEPNSPQAHANLGIALIQSGRRPEALEQFQQALELNPQLADPYFNLGLAAIEEHKLEEAQKNFKEAIRIDPNYVDAYNNLGAVLAQLGKTDQAIHCLQQAAERRPNDAQVHNNLGNVFLQSGQTAEAIDQYETALKMVPYNARAWANLAEAYAASNRFALAIDAAEKAIEFAKNRGDAQLANTVRGRMARYQNSSR